MVIFDNCYTVIIFERMNLKTTLVYMALAALTGMLGIQAQTVQGYTHSGHPTGQPPFPLTSYVELANPQAVDADSWKGVTKPSCAWGSVYERYRKESHPKLHKKSLRLKGWKANGYPPSWLSRRPNRWTACRWKCLPCRTGGTPCSMMPG